MKLKRFLTCSDLHLILAKPPCRPETKEGWFELQKATLIRLTELIDEYDAPLIIAGDIFENARAREELSNLFLDIMQPYKDRLYILAGNHDKFFHNPDLTKTSFGILTKVFTTIQNSPYSNVGGIDYNMVDEYKGKHEILFMHELTIDGRSAHLAEYGGTSSQAWLDKFPNAAFIITGDNHHKFVHADEGNRVVINPGCMTRQSIDFVDYSPAVFLVDINEGVHEILLPDKEVSLSTTHRDVIVERDERIAEFMDLVNSQDKSTALDFVARLRSKMVNGVIAKDKALLAFLEKVLRHVQMMRETNGKGYKKED